MMRRVVAIIAGAVVAVLAGASAAAARAPDPLAPGSAAVSELEYSAGQTSVSDPETGASYQVGLRGLVYVPSTAGPRPQCSCTANM